MCRTGVETGGQVRFSIDMRLLAESRAALAGRGHVFWVVGGAGSGKTTVCRTLSTTLGIPVYDMDAHIYGTYHARFTHDRHPVNTEWSTAPDGLAWLLDMSWDEFDAFNRAALPEYLDLLAEDLAYTQPEASLFIDGGICNPALVARVIPPGQIVCLAQLEWSSDEIWSETGDRASMKAAVQQLPRQEEAWRTFLEFDERITQCILEECRANDIAVCSRGDSESVDDVADRVARMLGIP